MSGTGLTASSTFTPDLERKLIELLGSSNLSGRAIARAVGIGWGPLSKWLMRGRAGMAPYVALARAFDERAARTEKPKEPRDSKPVPAQAKRWDRRPVYPAEKLVAGAAAAAQGVREAIPENGHRWPDMPQWGALRAALHSVVDPTLRAAVLCRLALEVAERVKHDAELGLTGTTFVAGESARRAGSD